MCQAFYNSHRNSNTKYVVSSEAHEYNIVSDGFRSQADNS